MEEVQCPACTLPMVENTAGKAKNPKAPDYKCQDSQCKFDKDPEGNYTIPSKYTTAIWVNQKPKAPSYTPKAPVQKKPDWDEISWGKCKHAFLVEAYKLGKPLDDKTKKEAQEWANFSMEKKLPF